MIQAAAAVNDALLKTAQQEGLAGGSTAVFAFVDDSQVLLGHLGDSKAVLCHLSTPETMPAAHRHQQHTAGAYSGHQQTLKAAAMTVDHAPDRPDELARITAAGGFVSRATAGAVTSLHSLSYTLHNSLPPLPELHCCLATHASASLPSATHALLMIEQLFLSLQEMEQFSVIT